MSPHKEVKDDGRKVAENFRVFPEGDDVLETSYSAGRNTSECGNAHRQNTFPHQRAQVAGEFQFCSTCTSTSRTRTPRPGTAGLGGESWTLLVHGVDPTTMEPILERAS